MSGLHLGSSDAETPQPLADLVTGLSLEEWEWGPIGDNTLAYCNWCKAVARVTGQRYDEVFREFRGVVAARWEARFAAAPTDTTEENDG